MSAKNWLQLLILSLLWGGSFFFVVVALEGLPVLTTDWSKGALAALCLAIHWLQRVRGFHLERRGAVFPGESLLPRHLAGLGLIDLGLLAIDGRFLRWRLA